MIGDGARRGGHGMTGMITEGRMGMARGGLTRSREEHEGLLGDGARGVATE
jgi:hypothetical protein